MAPTAGLWLLLTLQLQHTTSLLLRTSIITPVYHRNNQIVSKQLNAAWSTSKSSSSSISRSATTAAADDAYATHWEELLLAEHREATAELKARRATWSQRRLEQSGLSVFDATAIPESELYGEKLVRISKVGETRWNDYFSRGDVLLLSPASFHKKSSGRDKENDSFVPRECCVVDTGKDWLTVGVGSSWPMGLWESRRRINPFMVRLDRIAPQAPLLAQRKSLSFVRDGNAGEAAALLADSFFWQRQQNDGTTRVGLRNGSGKDTPSRFMRGATFMESVGGGGDVSCDITTTTLEVAIQKAIDAVKVSISFKPNKSQEEAIAWALSRRISLIRGPPGTGKTRVAALLVATALRLRGAAGSGCDGDGGSMEGTAAAAAPRVLAVAHSNGAADVLLEALLDVGVPAIRVGRPASISPSVLRRTVVAMAETHPEVVALRAQARNTTLPPHIRSAAASNAKQCVLEIRRTMIDTAPVVVASCVGAHQLLNHNNDDDDDNDDETTRHSSSPFFPIVVVDEAAQTTEPALICALASAKAEQIVLVGDTRQLPPTVASGTHSLRSGLGLSPMARLEQIYNINNKKDNNNNNEEEEEEVGQQRTLRVQYRMCPALLEHPSRYFYNGLVQCAATTNDDNDDESSIIPPPCGFPWPAPNIPLAFVHIGNDLEITHDFGGKSNAIEAELVGNIVSHLLMAGENYDSQMGSSIAVISPYSRQVDRIRTELAKNLKHHQNQELVRVGTVDSFQGQETDVVVFSAVRSNSYAELGFLNDPRRLCVAITRAKRGLVIVGDYNTLRASHHWAALLDSCKERGCFMNAMDVLGFYEDSMTRDVDDGDNNNNDREQGLKENFVENGEEAVDLLGLFDDIMTHDDDDDDNDDDYEQILKELSGESGEEHLAK